MEGERLGNGGTYRVTAHINRRPAVNIHHARRYSVLIGLPLNRFVTINFSAVGCPSSEASRAFQKILAQRFAPWLRRAAANDGAIPPTYVWAIEAGGRQVAAHWLVHVPRKLQRFFDRKLEEWLASLFQAVPDSQAVDVRPVYNLIGAQRYVLKGIDPVWAKHLGVRPVGQGSVVGKRSGFSRNLGPAARSRGGYRPMKLFGRRPR